ncbi:MAG: hypothetical protein AAFX54_03160 [Pseudomonadota bacterium]
MTAKKIFARPGRRNAFAALTFLSALTAFAMAPASACYTVQFKNDTRKPVKLIWRAMGCGGVKHWITLTCKTKTIQPTEWASYKYKWGTTTPTVIAYEKVKKNDRLDRSITYDFWSGKFRKEGKHNPGTPGCGGKYYIALSEAERKERLQ